MARDVFLTQQESIVVSLQDRICQLQHALLLLHHQCGLPLNPNLHPLLQPPPSVSMHASASVGIGDGAGRHELHLGPPPDTSELSDVDDIEDNDVIAGRQCEGSSEPTSSTPATVTAADPAKTETAATSVVELTAVVPPHRLLNTSAQRERGQLVAGPSSGLSRRQPPSAQLKHRQRSRLPDSESDPKEDVEMDQAAGVIPPSPPDNYPDILRVAAAVSMRGKKTGERAPENSSVPTAPASAAGGGDANGMVKYLHADSISQYRPERDSQPLGIPIIDSVRHSTGERGIEYLSARGANWRASATRTHADVTARISREPPAVQHATVTHKPADKMETHHSHIPAQYIETSASNAPRVAPMSSQLHHRQQFTAQLQSEPPEGGGIARSHADIAAPVSGHLLSPVYSPPTSAVPHLHDTSFPDVERRTEFDTGGVNRAGDSSPSSHQVSPLSAGSAVPQWSAEQVGQWLVALGLSQQCVQEFVLRGISGQQLLALDSKHFKQLPLDPAERTRIKRILKDLKSVSDKERRIAEKERREKDKLMRKAEKLAEKATKRK